MARFHQAAAGRPIFSSFSTSDKAHQDNILDKEVTFPSSTLIPPEQAKWLVIQRDRLKNIQAPGRMIHGDFFVRNFLFGEEKQAVSVVDFALARPGNPETEIGLYAYSKISETPRRAFDALLRGYNRDGGSSILRLSHCGG